MEELRSPSRRARLRRRGASRKRRFEKAREVEIEHYPFFDYIVVNEEVERAAAELRGIIYAERCRRFRQASKAEALLPKP